MVVVTALTVHLVATALTVYRGSAPQGDAVAGLPGGDAPPAVAA